jgi:hypothetical protein
VANNSAERQSNPFGFIAVIAGVMLQMLGLSGMADNVVQWRGFFEHGVMRHYNELVVFAIGGAPAPLVSLAIGYLLSCVGFFVAAFQTMQEHRRYLASVEFPRDYEAVEDVLPYDERGLDKVESWAHRRSRNAVTRLVWMSLIWPLFLLWALYVWSFVPRRRTAVPMTDAELRAVRLSSFDYRKATRREAFAFFKWTAIALLGFGAALFVFSDFANA